MAVQQESDVLVIGAGPVGLFAALSLAGHGLDVQVVDRGRRGAAHSYALALHPDSLHLLDECGALEALLDRGHRVERMGVYRGDERVGSLDFTALGGSHPFLLVAPQSAIETTLAQRLREEQVEVLWNHQALTMQQDERKVVAKIGRMEQYATGYPETRMQWMVAKEFETRAGFVVGADGCHSFVRNALAADFSAVGVAETFGIYEFRAPLDLADEARVVFHEDSTNVFWPLGGACGRWSFQVDAEASAEPTAQALQALVEARAPWFRTPIAEIAWYSTALFERRLAERFGEGRCWLAGDAAHVTGPVGVQSMNVGLREAHDLAGRFASILTEGAPHDVLVDYASERRGEWSGLLGLGGGVRSGEATPEWARDLAARLLPCIPASGERLDVLLRQIGLALA